MKKYILVMSFFSLALISGCASGYVSTRPADLRYARPVSPGPSYIWTSGEWIYSGRSYHWREGSWQRSRQGQNWRAGYWENNRQGYKWHKGHWQ